MSHAGLPPVKESLLSPFSHTRCRPRSFAAQVWATYEGQFPTTTSRREVVTFDGSGTAAVEVTENGVNRSCTLALPHGQLTCS
jgi:hypothetical protein